MNYKNIIVSVGAFTVEEAKELNLAETKTALLMLDPLPDVCRRFKEVFGTDSHVYVFEKAISSKTETVVFYVKGESSSLFEITGYEKKIVVATDTLSTLVPWLDAWNCGTEKLFLIMNCEGAEIEIVMTTSIGLLKKFEQIQN